MKHKKIGKLSLVNLRRKHLSANIVIIAIKRSLSNAQIEEKRVVVYDLEHKVGFRHQTRPRPLKSKTN